MSPFASLEKEQKGHFAHHAGIRWGLAALHKLASLIPTLFASFSLQKHWVLPALKWMLLPDLSCRTRAYRLLQFYLTLGLQPNVSSATPSPAAAAVGGGGGNKKAGSGKLSSGAGVRKGDGGKQLIRGVQEDEEMQTERCQFHGALIRWLLQVLPVCKEKSSKGKKESFQLDLDHPCMPYLPHRNLKRPTTSPRKRKQKRRKKAAGKDKEV